jgi:hypothetical protein
MSVPPDAPGSLSSLTRRSRDSALGALSNRFDKDSDPTWSRRLE